MATRQRRVINLVKKVIQNIYNAGQFGFPYNDGHYLATKAFFLARACDLADCFADEFEDCSAAKRALLRALKRSGIVVPQYYFSRDTQADPLDLLADFLMGDADHAKGIATSIMENFKVEGRSLSRSKRVTRGRVARDGDDSGDDSIVLSGRRGDDSSELVPGDKVYSSNLPSMATVHSVGKDGRVLVTYNDRDNRNDPAVGIATFNPDQLSRVK